MAGPARVLRTFARILKKSRGIAISAQRPVHALTNGQGVRSQSTAPSKDPARLEFEAHCYIFIAMYNRNMSNAYNDMGPVPELRNQIVALARRLRQADRSDSQNWTALMVLGAIQRLQGTATPTQVATELGLQSSNLAQLLGELDRGGLLQRSPDPADKRKVRLALTQPGLATVREARGRRDRWLSDAMQGCLSAREQAQLLAAGALMQRVALWRGSAAEGPEPGPRTTVQSV